MRTRAAALLTVLSLLGGACSGGSDTGAGRETTSARETTGQQEESTQLPETTSAPEATLGSREASPDVVLRIEGDKNTTFSGICTVGVEEDVISGRVPKRFTFAPEGRELSCRIQKRDSRAGALKVIFTANGTTRSVQQTRSRSSEIRVSYGGE